MLIIYVDETGDPSGTPVNGGSKEYALGVLVVEAVRWRPALDAMIEFRRDLRNRLNVPITAEIKASHLVRNEGWFKGKNLRPSLRQQIFRDHFRLIEDQGLKAFSVWVSKSGRTPIPQVKEVLWNMLFQRIQKTYPGQHYILMHDEGDEKYIRKHARRARRFLTAGQATGGTVRLDAELILDDPVSRQSDSSYFVQCADLVAYSAAKAMIRGGARADKVCPQGMWKNLGSACVEAVNGFARRSDPSLPPGIAATK